jgi:hypothetical protein
MHVLPIAVDLSTRISPSRITNKCNKLLDGKKGDAFYYAMVALASQKSR